MDEAESNQQRSEHMRNFDPFRIGLGHREHSGSVDIVHLEESGKVFCPLCLQKSNLTIIDEVDTRTYDQYVFNLFEALDQNSEKKKLRMIVLHMLNIVLKRRPIHVKSDNEFHNFLRIINKVLSSDAFNDEEFPQIARIFSTITSKFAANNPMPLESIWRATKRMLKYSEERLLGSPIDVSVRLTQSSINFLGHLALVVKTYQELLGRFAIGNVSEYIFPLSEKDTPGLHDRKHYKSNQLECLRFVSRNLVPNCWPYLNALDRNLNQNEIDMIIELFEALKECFLSSVRLNDEEFICFLTNIDSLRLAYNLINRNRELSDLRYKIRSFVRCFVHYHIKEKFGEDQKFNEYFTMKNIVEMNHRNAIQFYKECPSKTSFYVLVNVVAMEQKSEYFNYDRVRKVIKSVDPENLSLTDSKVLVRAYGYAAASVVTKIYSIDSVESFFTKVWRGIEDGSSSLTIEEEFCFHERVFRWFFEHSEFIKHFTTNTMKSIIGRSTKDGTIELFLKTILENQHYKAILISFIKSDDSASDFIRELAKMHTSSDTSSAFLTEPDSMLQFHTNPEYTYIISEMNALLPALFHNSVLEANNRGGSATNLNQVQKFLDMLLILMQNCQRFKLVLDDQFIEDIFKFVESCYEAFSYASSDAHENLKDLIVLINQFIALLIEDVNPSLMMILKHLDYTTLGYMYCRIADYTKGDIVAESIARVLIAYDGIEYPIQNDISKSLCPMAVSTINWMMSRSDRLHQLSLRLIPKLLDGKSVSRSIDACIATGLVHMLATNPNILMTSDHLKQFISILNNNEALKYSPLIEQLMDFLPEHIKNEIDKILYGSEERLVSSPLSFSSSQSSAFEEERVDVANILTRLTNEEEPTSSGRLSNSLFISRVVKDPHSVILDTESWERIAYETTRDADAF